MIYRVATLPRDFSFELCKKFLFCFLFFVLCFLLRGSKLKFPEAFCLNHAQFQFAFPPHTHNTNMRRFTMTMDENLCAKHASNSNSVDLCSRDLPAAVVHEYNFSSHANVFACAARIHIEITCKQRQFATSMLLIACAMSFHTIQIEIIHSLISFVWCEISELQKKTKTKKKKSFIRIKPARFRASYTYT